MSAQQGRVRWGPDEYYSQPASQSQRSSQPSQQLQPGASHDQDDEDNDSRDEEDLGWRYQGTGLTLAITASKGRVGCCSYDGKDGRVRFLLDQEDGDSWDLVTIVLEQTQPNLVLTSASADTSFLTTLREVLSSLPCHSSTSRNNPFSTASSNSLPSEDAEGGVRLEHRPPREFYPAQGKTALTQLVVIERGRYADVGGDGEEGFVFHSTASGKSESMQERDEGEDDEGEVDPYAFGRRRKRKGKRSTAAHGDEERRNGELRLESFMTGLDSCPLTLGCAGALLGHLARSQSAAGVADLDRAGFEVSGIELLKLERVMHINRDALSSLQIFNDESHASVHSAKTKEGLSLFGILNICRTPPGRRLMRQWFLRPSLDLAVIEKRQSAVDCFVRGENQHVAESIQSHFRGIQNVFKTIQILSNGKGTMKDWQSVWQFLYCAIMVRDATASLAHKRGIEIVEKILMNFDADEFKELGTMINDVIDWEESTLQNGRVCVKPGVDSDLDQLRRTYHGLGSLLSKIAIDLGVGVPPEFAENLSVVYFPQIGYLITVPAREGVRTPEDFEVDGWEFQFATEESAYFKSEKCRDLDRHLGDVVSFITDKEIEIQHALLVRLLEQADQMVVACECIAELDCLLAFAEAARIYEWTKPKLTEASVCDITGGRHPLVELCVDSFVKNDTILVGGRGIGREDEQLAGDKPASQGSDAGLLDTDQSMLIITGANFSGKSVLLKQIALITFMAHLGSFVPAEAALIGLTDRILTRIWTRESIARGASAFMIDLQQISFILRNATPRSLVIIDEFGKGTESDDGAGLFVGVVEHLIRRGPETPRVAVATHFQDVFANGFLPPSLPIGLAHMEILLNPRHSITRASSVSVSSLTTLEHQEVTYLYRLSPGLATSSHAAACAALFGIDAVTVARATAISSLLSKFEIDAIVNSSLSEEEKEELEESERIARRFLAWELREEDNEMELDEVREGIGRVLGIVKEEGAVAE